MKPPHNYIIKFDKVTKNFSLNSQKTFKEFLPALFLGEKTVNKLTVLDSISLEIRSGESIGIIGHNGSGKSTILKLIAGVMSPSSGKISVFGRVSPIIELGAGMHPELTGRENIFLNGSILGLKRRQIEKNYQNIVDFSGLHSFINQPIKHYSSGMYMRLAFAIAVHSNPEILIIDEILAVGDASFQTKCLAKMEEFKKNGVTILFVSHSLDTVKNFCSRVIYIEDHHIIAQGQPSIVIDTFINRQQPRLSTQAPIQSQCHINNTTTVQKLKNQNISHLTPLDIRISIFSKISISHANIDLSLFNQKNGTIVFSTSNRQDHFLINIKQGENTINFHIDKLDLLPITLGLIVKITDNDNNTHDTQIYNQFIRVSRPRQNYFGVAYIKHAWTQL